MIKPTIVLCVITLLTAALLITAHSLTYRDTSGELTDALRQKCELLMGEGEYRVVTDRELPDGVYKIIADEKGRTAFEIIADGYNKGGLDLLIAMNDDGSPAGIEIVSIKETPGLGTTVSSGDFLSMFTGKSGNVKIVRRTPREEGEVEAVSGATYSSKGVASAVNTAINAYKTLKEGSEQ